MVEQRGLATSPVSSGGTPARKNCSELGNAALPVLDSGQGGDTEVEEALARHLAGWLGRRRRGMLGRGCCFAAELARRNGEERERWKGEMRTAGARGGVVASKWRRRG